MADMASIIAGIDGYRRYEQNRAIDLNNQAQNMKNQEAGQILDLKTQLAALQNNPYAKYNIWDPVGRRQQLLSDDDQLKIASKWASSIKNLAPEKREQGYRQFLRAMPSLGIDVSDMPQGYDEGYIDMVAGLGVDTQTRYQNEQENSRLERQIEANREARQDEFDKRLAAFDYENRYKSDAEKRRLGEKDDFVRGLGLDNDTTNRLLAANREISVPEDKGMDDRMLQRLTANPQDETARTYFANKAMANKYIKGLEPVENKVSFKDAMQGLKNAKDSGASVESLNSLASNMGYEGLNFENLSDFDKKLNTYNKSKQTFPDMPEAYHRKQAGLLSAEDEAFGVGLNAGAKAQAQQPFLIDRDNNASQNRITENTISNAQQNDYKLQQMQLQSELDKDKATYQNFLNMSLEQYKSTLPTEKMLDIEAESRATGIPVDEIVKQNKHLAETQQRLDIMQKQAQIRQIMANAAKTQAEIPYVGMTDAQKNALAWQNNPELREFPGWSGGSTTVNIDQREEQEYNKQMAKQDAEAVKKYREAGNEAASTIFSIDNLIKAIENNKVYQGTVGEMINGAKRLLSSAGYPIKGLDDAAILDSGKSLLLGKIRRDVMSGTTSDRDINFLVNMVPSLGKTKEQNLAIAKMYKNAYQRQLDAAKFVNKYMRENGGRWDNDGEYKLFDFMNKPLFSDNEKAIASGIPLNEIKNQTELNNNSYNFANTSDNDLLVLGE